MRLLKEKTGIDLKEALFPFIAGLIAHGYIMFSYNPNRDEFISIFHHGSGYDFGRWFHTIIGNLMFRVDGCYSMPWLNGLVFIFFISLSALLFAEPFKMKNRVTKCLFMILFMVFPVTTATLSYMATAPFYAVGVFLAAVAFFLSHKHKYGFVFGIFAVCASLGIYQAYFALVSAFVFFLLFIRAISDEEDIKTAILTAVKQLAMLVAGLVLYFVINKVILATRNVSMTEYQNLDNMGVYSLGSIWSAFCKCYTDFFRTLFGDYYYIFPYKLLNVIVLAAWILFAVALVVACVKRIRKKPVNLIVVLGMVLLIPFAINLINVMCAGFIDGIYTLMCYSAFFMLGAPMLLLDNVFTGEIKALKAAIASMQAVLMLVVFIYIKYSNMCYLAYDIHYDQAYFEFSSLATRIRSVEDYDNDLPIVFAGTYDDCSKLWELRYADALPGAYTTGYLMNGETRRANFFKIFLGFTYAERYPEDELYEEDYYKEMSSYPDDGSIKRVDDAIIVKFSDYK